jgi:hypothetical protein
MDYWKESYLWQLLCRLDVYPSHLNDSRDQRAGSVQTEVIVDKNEARVSGEDRQGWK